MTSRSLSYENSEVRCEAELNCKTVSHQRKEFAADRPASVAVARIAHFFAQVPPQPARQHQAVVSCSPRRPVSFQPTSIVPIQASVAMSGPYETYESRTRRHTAGRSALGYWIPLALTITAASIGLAAWIWSERQDHEDGDDEDERRVQGSQKREDHDRYARTQGETGPRPPPSYGADVRTDASFANRTEPSVPEDGSAGMMARMSGVIRRTPSPQQLYDEASRRVAAGVAAAGAAVGGALSSIREESKDDYRDHSRWSEEAEMRANQGNARGKNTSQPLSDPRAGTTTLPGASMLSGKHQSNFKRKTVVIIVSADAHEAIHGAGTDDLHEDAVSHPWSVFRRSQLTLSVYSIASTCAY